MIRPLEDTELEQLLAIREVAFLDWNDYTKASNRKVHLDRLKYRYGSFEGDRLAASASWYPFSMYLYGKPQTVWGLASVCTGGEFRRQGHVGRLLDAGLEMMNRQGVGWCLEYPFDTRFYARWGWETVANGTFVELPPERLGGIRSQARRVTLDDDAGIAEMKAINAEWSSRYNFAFVRDDAIQKSWQSIFGKALWHGPNDRRFAYLMDDAYCVTIMGQDERLIVTDWGHRSAAGFNALRALWAGFEGQFKTVRIQLPSDSPLLNEWQEFVVPHPHPLHARIVNAQAALSQIPCDQFFSLVLEIKDDTCPWNNGRFRVKSDSERTLATPTQDSPDAKVDIRAIARILSGSTTVEAAEFYGEYRRMTDKGSQLALLKTGPCHMSLADYF